MSAGRRAGGRARRAPSRADRLPVEPLQHVAALALLATALYANSFGVGLILDNQLVIAQDPRIRALRAENVADILTQDYLGRSAVSGVYRPVTTLSYLVDYAVLGHGTRAAGYHAVNLALHVANAGLVYALGVMLLRSRVQAWCAAALFTAHPIATEAVTNIVGRADLLAALAVLVATVLYVRGTRASGATARRALLGVGVATTLGLLAKENAVTVVGAVLAYDVAYRLDAPAGRWRRVAQLARTGWVALVPPLVAVGLIRWRVYADTVVERPPFLDNPLASADGWTARWTALKALARSAGLLVWPHRLSWDYSYSEIPLATWPPHGWGDWQALLALAGLVAAIVGAWRLRRRCPAACFYILFALAAVLPTSNLVVPVGTIMAERLLYLPLVGFAACVVLVLGAVAQRLPAPLVARALPAAVALLVAALGVRTVLRNADWRDEVRLAQTGIDAAPRSAKVYLEYASAVSRRDGERADVDVLIAHAEHALGIMDDPPLPLERQTSRAPLFLGIFYKTKGTQVAGRGGDGRAWYLRAEAALERAAAIEAAQAAAYRRAAAAQGLRDDALPARGDHNVAYHLGDVHMLLGEPAKAVEDFARLRRLAPLVPQTYFGVARAATATGDAEAAVAALTIAMTLGRRDAQTQRLLIDAYRRLDPGGCAVRLRGDGAELDATCPLVQAHVCAAHVELVASSVDARQGELARRLADAAIRGRRCDPAPFEPLLARAGGRRR